MKKTWIIILALLLTSCSTEPMAVNIGQEKFSDQTELEMFDIASYIKKIDPIVNDLNYIRLDSIFLSDEQEPFIISNRVKENILNIFNSFEKDHDTYALINFLDLHLKSLSQLEIDIMVYKIVEHIEADYFDLKDIVNEAQFLHLTRDYQTRITDTFLDNYIANRNTLDLYPDMYHYMDNLKRLINGGYQIRKFNATYSIFPDYTSVLVRYDEYYSDETAHAVDILVRESRNVVKANDVILIDNEAIAYKIDLIEQFLKQYPSSVYYDLFKNMFQDYFITLISNPNNLEVLTDSLTRYKILVMKDLKDIISRYESTTMGKILEDFVENIENNGGIYNDVFIDETIERINSSY